MGRGQGGATLRMPQERSLGAALAGTLVILLLRLVVPLGIPRWPLIMGVLAMAIDAIDVIIVDAIGSSALWDERYAEIDKLLDTYYLSFEAFVAWRWSNPWARLPALLLFVDRFVGALLYELSGARWLLLLFPNLFENWWLYCLVVERFWPRLSPVSPRTVALPLLLLAVPKFAQEYALHVAQVHPWMWVRLRLFGY